jgi:hypothetical protein
VENEAREGHHRAEDGGRHRSSEPRPIDPPSFRDEFYYNFRAILLIPLMSVILVGWGVETALDVQGDVPKRLLGVAAAVAGVFFSVSLVLYFKPGRLAGDSWRLGTARRRLGFMLRHAWMMVVLAVGLLWLLGAIAN